MIFAWNAKGVRAEDPAKSIETERSLILFLLYKPCKENGNAVAGSKEKEVVDFLRSN
jgi:hypothetical protein